VYVDAYTKSHQKAYTLYTFFFAGLVPKNDVSIRSPVYMTSNGTCGRTLHYDSSTRIPPRVLKCNLYL